MTTRQTVIEFDEKNFKGKIAIYPNCSTLNPGFIARAGPPFDDWTGPFQVGATGYRVTIQFSEKNLTPNSVFIVKHTNRTEAPHEMQSTIVNIIRKRLAKFLGRKVSTIKIIEQPNKWKRNLMKRTLRKKV